LEKLVVGVELVVFFLYSFDAVEDFEKRVMKVLGMS